MLKMLVFTGIGSKVSFTTSTQVFQIVGTLGSLKGAFAK
jgi:hypothetical protein